MVENTENIQCKICDINFKDDHSFNKHLRGHKISIEKYYTSQFPRYDKFDGSPINFKSKSHYFENDFNSKSNLAAWFKKEDDNNVKDYIFSYLEKRKTNKRLVFAPTQVELRSLLCPSIITIEKYFKEYRSLYEPIGLKSRFYNVDNKKTVSPTNRIITDSREQSPFSFGGEDYVSGLKYGDYKLEQRLRADDECVIERKSIPDFISTFSEQIDRFKNELNKCIDDKSYLVVVVEDSLSNALDFKNKCDVSPRLRVTPEYVFRNVRDLLQSSDKIQFLFINGKDEAAVISKKILLDGYLHTSMDLQLSYDKGTL